MKASILGRTSQVAEDTSNIMTHGMRWWLHAKHANVELDVSERLDYLFH